MPALLKSLIFGPNGRAMSPSHTRRRGRIYRYYVAREAIGDAENISKELWRLALLAPDIVEAILAGRMDQVLMLEQLERPLRACWEEQRRRLF